MRRRSRIVGASGGRDTMSSLEGEILAYDREVARLARRAGGDGYPGAGDEAHVDEGQGGGEEMTSHAGEHRPPSPTTNRRSR